jgi:hypothetical protein
MVITSPSRAQTPSAPHCPENRERRRDRGRLGLAAWGRAKRGRGPQVGDPPGGCRAAHAARISDPQSPRSGGPREDKPNRFRPGGDLAHA